MINEQEALRLFERINEELKPARFTAAIHSAKEFKDFEPIIELLKVQQLDIDQQQQVASIFKSISLDVYSAQDKKTQHEKAEAACILMARCIRAGLSQNKAIELVAEHLADSFGVLPSSFEQTTIKKRITSKKGDFHSLYKRLCNK